MDETPGASSQQNQTPSNQASVLGTAGLGIREVELMVNALQKVEILSISVRKKTKVIERLETLTYLGFFILLLMLGTVLIDIWNNKGASSENLASQINQQNVELQSISDKLSNIENNFANVSASSTVTSSSYKIH
jgi:hypothetical protein